MKFTPKANEINISFKEVLGSEASGDKKKNEQLVVCPSDFIATVFIIIIIIINVSIYISLLNILFLIFF